MLFKAQNAWSPLSAEDQDLAAHGFLLRCCSRAAAAAAGCGECSPSPTPSLNPRRSKLLLCCLVFGLQVLTNQAEDQRLKTLRRRKRNWILPPPRLMENVDYTKKPYIAKVSWSSRKSFRFPLDLQQWAVCSRGGQRAKHGETSEGDRWRWGEGEG